MQPAYRYRAHVARVVDADTLELDVDLGFRVTIRVAVRVRGVDAPELSTVAGKVARAAVLDLLAQSHAVVVETYKDRQTFARWVADVYVDDASLADWLIAQGHGVPA